MLDHIPKTRHQGKVHAVTNLVVDLEGFKVSMETSWLLVVVVVILCEWWLASTTADHCGHITEQVH